MSEKPEGVETWRVAMDRYGGAVICADPSPEKLRSLSYDEVAYCLHAAQRLPVVEAERDRLNRENRLFADAIKELTETVNFVGKERDAAQARIAMLEKALAELVGWIAENADDIGLRPDDTNVLLRDARALLSKETDR